MNSGRRIAPKLFRDLNRHVEKHSIETWINDSRAGKESSIKLIGRPRAVPTTQSDLQKLVIPLITRAIAMGSVDAAMVLAAGVLATLPAPPPAGASPENPDVTLRQEEMRGSFNAELGDLFHQVVSARDQQDVGSPRPARMRRLSSGDRYRQAGSPEGRKEAFERVTDRKSVGRNPQDVVSVEATDRKPDPSGARREGTDPEGVGPEAVFVEATKTIRSGLSSKTESLSEIYHQLRARIRKRPPIPQEELARELMALETGSYAIGLREAALHYLTPLTLPTAIPDPIPAFRFPPETEQAVRGAVASAAAHKGLPWSQTEYEAHRYMVRYELAKIHGALAVDAFDSALAQAPVKGGRFNPWSGD